MQLILTQVRVKKLETPMCKCAFYHHFVAKAYRRASKTTNVSKKYLVNLCPIYTTVGDLDFYKTYL